ncbi:MAG: MFS transporter, partial [Bacteroidota bacterium]
EKSLALALSIFGGSRLLGNILSGPLIDRFTARKVFSFMLFPMMISLVPLLFTDHIWAFWLFMGGCGISGALSSLSSTAAWAELYGTTHLGAIRSMVSTVMVFGSAIAPVATGYLFAGRSMIHLTWWGALVLMIGLTALGFWVIKKK